MGQDKKKAGDAEKGKEVFQQCGVCHNADSTEKKMGPGLKGLFQNEKMTNGKKPTEANVRANASQRDAWKKKLDAVRAENATRLRTVRLVVRAGPETIAERGSE